MRLARLGTIAAMLSVACVATFVFVLVPRFGYDMPMPGSWTDRHIRLANSISGTVGWGGVGLAAIAIGLWVAAAIKAFRRRSNSN